MDLERLKQLCAEATPGEWLVDETGTTIRLTGDNPGQAIRKSVASKVFNRGPGSKDREQARKDLKCCAEARNALPELIAAHEALQAERDKLQRFKDWVHAYLDQHDVPHHPPGVHGAEGCRIGDRMDWLMQKIESAR